MAKRIWKAPKAAAVLAAAVIVGACGGGSPQARSITLTFIRDAQSQADVDGVIDTSIPGPGLSSDGKGQAQQVAHGHRDFDAVYASPTAESRQTAAPLAGELGKQVEVLDGLAPIDAGWYNGSPQKRADSTYLLAPVDWLNGDRQDSVPGSISGTDFNSRFAAAVRKIYNDGHDNPVAFTQGMAIMVWTLMNAKNGKDSLLTTHPLPNGGRVVISGNPITGWTLLEWDGIRNFTT